MDIQLIRNSVRSAIVKINSLEGKINPDNYFYEEIKQRKIQLTFASILLSGEGENYAKLN